MAILPLAQDIHGAPYIANVDSGGNLAVPTEQYIKSGGLYVPISAANPLPTSITGSLANDGITPSGSSIAQTPVLFNETNWDRQRGNTQGILLASAARTTSILSATQTNYNARGIVITVNVTAISGTSPSLLLQITDPSLNPYSPGSSAITATGVYRFVVYPATLTAPSNSIGAIQLPVPRSWACFFSITGTTPSITFSSTVDYIL